MPEYPMFISDLSEDSRTHVTNCANGLLLKMESAEGRLRTYLKGEDPYAGGSVIKTIHWLNMTSEAIAAMVDELIAKHGLPGDTKELGK